MGEDEKTREERLKRALEGTDSGSDTRAGSLRGGSASGSDNDPDTDAVNADLAEKGRQLAKDKTRAEDEKSQPDKDVS
ncbi:MULTISPECIES: ribonuclease [Brevundimonas]|uniref:ribonuclease n=1 Tax=Brevundimonas pishanensis TaxID=2896315 RepID=UPI001FA74389|nr:ribonuclease [Brevundimonas pishanensis]